MQSIDGRTYEPLVVAPHKAAVLVFILQDCPICNGYAPQIQRLASEFESRGAVFYIVHVDPTLSTDDARRHAKDFGYTLPVLIDRKHELVGRLDVRTVPTAVVLGPDGAPRYAGRIDNRYAALGRSREAATTHDLRDALLATIDGKPARVTRAPAVGCSVPDLPKNPGR
jgi:peroxiredoxin